MRSRPFIKAAGAMGMSEDSFFACALRMSAMAASLRDSSEDSCASFARSVSSALRLMRSARPVGFAMSASALLQGRKGGVKKWRGIHSVQSDWILIP